MKDEKKLSMRAGKGSIYIYSQKYIAQKAFTKSLASKRSCDFTFINGRCGSKFQIEFEEAREKRQYIINVQSFAHNSKRFSSDGALVRNLSVEEIDENEVET